MILSSRYNVSLPLVEPRSDNRQPGLHVSTIYGALANDLYPKWFKQYADDPHAFAGQVNHFTKGLVLERAWGDALSHMLPTCFEVPEPRYVKREHRKTMPLVSMGEDDYITESEVLAGQSATEGCWCSADGLTPGGSLERHEGLAWPQDWPDFEPGVRAIHECKVTLKSSREATSPITHEKFITWQWQVMAYCYAYQCTRAYIHVLHLMGDYKERPFTPQAACHRFDWEWDEIVTHWEWLMTEAKTRGLE